MSEKTRVLVLAAGFGTRLGRLTEHTPKPLLPLDGGAIIDAAFWHLEKAGFTNIIVNLHYLGEKIREYLVSKSKDLLEFEFSVENPILDTGGAIKKVLSQYPDSNLLVLNSDALFGADLDLSGFVSRFEMDLKKPAAAMLLREHSNPKEFGAITTTTDPTDGRLTVCQIVGKPEVGRSSDETDYIFTGIHIFSPSILRFLDGLGDIFSSTLDLYPKLLAAGETVRAELYHGYWCDTGTEERLLEARNAVRLGKIRLL